MALATRISLSLSAPQLAYLQAEADRLGLSIGDIIRRILDQHRGESLRSSQRPAHRVLAKRHIGDDDNE